MVVWQLFSEWHLQVTRIRRRRKSDWLTALVMRPDMGLDLNDHGTKHFDGDIPTKSGVDVHPHPRSTLRPGTSASSKTRQTIVEPRTELYPSQ
jgi:hypothetical protein